MMLTVVPMTCTLVDMTDKRITIRQLANELDVDPASLLATIDGDDTGTAYVAEDIPGDPIDFVLTQDGEEWLRSVGAETRDDMADLAEVVERIDDLDHQAREAREERDAVIRRMLGDGVTYSELSEVTGLSRSGLDTIRRGERSRSVIGSRARPVPDHEE